MFDQRSEKSLQASQYNPVKHYGPFMLTVLIRICKIEPFRKSEVALDRRALPRPSQSILDLNIYLGAVNSAVTLVNIIFHALCVQGLFQRFGGFFPILIGPYGFLGPGAQCHLKIIKGGIQRQTC